MKFTITLKDPDGFYEGVRSAATNSVKRLSSSSSDSKILTEIRVTEIEEALSEWVRYGECIDIEFDTEKRTAVVCKRNG